MKSSSFELKSETTRRGAQLVPLGMPIVTSKDAFTKHDKYVFNKKKIEQFDDISFRKHFGITFF